MKDSSGISSDGFERLLTWLDTDPNAAGLKYESIRQRLIRVFAGRGCHEPEDLADLTIDRVITKIPEIAATYEGDPALYFYSVGRHIHLEWLRRESRRGDTEFDRVRAVEKEEEDESFTCLDECLEAVPSSQRTMLIDYYRDDKKAKIEHRRIMAERLGVTPTALQIRLHRLRKSLRACVEGCMGQR